MDVWVEWIGGADPPEERSKFQLYLGSAELTADIKVLTRQEDGSTLARIWTPRPLLAMPRDRFILRCPSPPLTVGGGEVLDIAPPVRSSRVKTVKRLGLLHTADDANRLAILVGENSNGRKLDELLRITGFTRDRVIDLVSSNSDLC